MAKPSMNWRGEGGRGSGFRHTQGNKARREGGKSAWRKKGRRASFREEKKEKFCNYLLERGQKKTAQPGGWI